MEQLAITKLIFSLLFIFSTVAYSKVTYVDHALGQFAGETGLFSVGLGKTITSKYKLGFMYGVVPTEVSKGPIIETVAFRQTYDIHYWDIMTFYLGLNVYHVLGLRYQTSKYGISPDGYYPIGSIRGLLNLGVSIDVNQRKQREYYFETGINDVWITNYINNIGTMNPIKHFSMALGVKQSF